MISMTFPVEHDVNYVVETSTSTGVYISVKYRRLQKNIVYIMISMASPVDNDVNYAVQFSTYSYTRVLQF